MAKFAVEALSNPAARNAIVPVGGPEALSQLDVVQIFEEVGGRPFTLHHIPITSLQEQMQQATDPLQESFAALMLTLARGLPIDMTHTLHDFPMELLTVRDYAQQVLKPEGQPMPI